jgi:hypothetical protein
VYSIGWQTKIKAKYQSVKVKYQKLNFFKEIDFQTIKEKDVSFSFQLIFIYSGKKKVYQNSNSDSGSLRVSLFKNSGVPSIALYVGSATQHSQLALLKRGIKKFIIRIRNS